MHHRVFRPFSCSYVYRSTILQNQKTKKTENQGIQKVFGFQYQKTRKPKNQGFPELFDRCKAGAKSSRKPWFFGFLVFWYWKPKTFWIPWFSGFLVFWYWMLESSGRHWFPALLGVGSRTLPGSLGFGLFVCLVLAPWKFDYVW